MGEAADPGFALLGAGTFVQMQYLPLLKTLPVAMSLQAVWSRSQAAAEAMFAQAKDFSPTAKTKWGEDGLEEILQDTSVHGVFVVLPPQVQLKIVSRALKAGKHVLQEKPVGSTVKEACDVLRTYEGLRDSGSKIPIWAVGENYRFEPGLIAGARMAETIGNFVNVQVIVESPMPPTNPYFSSAWRRDPAFEGAFIKDGGVHFVAGLRLITGCNISSVGAITTHADPALPPPDNVSAILKLDNGCPGVLVMSWSSTSRQLTQALWRVVGSTGTVEVSRQIQNGLPGYLVTLLRPTENPKPEFHPFAGVQEELRSFVQDVTDGLAAEKADPNSSVLESLRDLAVIEALLESGANGGRSTFVKSAVW